MNILRWLLIVPACVLAWYLSLIVGLILVSIAESFCSKEKMISGFCTASWFQFAENLIYAFCGGLVAFVVITVSYLLAPIHKDKMVMVAYFLGTVVAIYMVVETGAWLVFGSALVIGFVTCIGFVKLGKCR